MMRPDGKKKGFGRVRLWRTFAYWDTDSNNHQHEGIDISLDENRNMN